MPNPNALADIVDVTVEVASVQSGRSPFSNVMVASEFDAPAEWTGDGFDRSKMYIGDLDETLDAMEADGFEPSDNAVRMVRSVLRQTPRPDRVLVGRKDPTDATWGAALDAIQADRQDWYGFAIEDRDETSIKAAAAWAEGEFAIYVAQSAAAAVPIGTPGNELADLKAIGYKRTIYLWHDPETASELGPATIYTAEAGPWDLSALAGGILNVEIGTPTATTEVQVTFDAAAASVLGTDATPGDISGDLPGQIDIEVDNDGVTISVPLLAADFVDPTLPLASELGAKIMGYIGASKIFAGDATGGDAGKIRIRSRRLGSGSQIDIKNTSTANILTAFGLSVGVTNGTGDASNAAAVTPAELVTLLDGDLPAEADAFVGTGLLADYVGIQTVGEGEFYTLRVLGATLNGVLGFTSSLTTGDGTDEDFIDCAWLGGRLGGLNLDAPRPQGHVTWDNFRPDSLDGRIKADSLTSSQRTLIREQGGNTFELRTTDRTPGELHFGRTISGIPADSRVGADWLAYRLAEAVKGALDDAADGATQIDFTDQDARVVLLGVCGGVLIDADRFGLTIADLDPPDPSTNKNTGLVVPYFAQLTEANVSNRRWGPIRFVQRRRGALEQVVIRGTLI